MKHPVYSRGTVAALCAVLALPLAAGAQSVDPAALLAKHQAYVGWHAGDGSVKTLRLRGAATRDGKTVATLRKLYYGYAHRDTLVDEHGIEVDHGFTGSIFWTTNHNGFTVRPAGEVVRYLADVDAVFGELTGGIGASFVRRETVDGADAVVLHLTPKAGFPLDVAVDPGTGAYRWATIDPGGKYETTVRNLAYTEVVGKRFLTSWRSGNGRTTYAYTTVEPNATIAPDDLR
ncbi:MAG: hypothetical protein JOZ24_13375, partial [Candidatus Eremiobacteraeota bacterium]|nr:hypothetical protein [Candidatus Eremiobacteraeota bacterium]